MKLCIECKYSSVDGDQAPCVTCDETGNNWVVKDKVIGFIPCANNSATMSTMVVEGVKFDNNKPQWSLMPWKALSQVVDVLTYGAKKYAPDNWKKVPNARQRYIDAGFRHLTAYAGGEKNDSETGLSHLAHATCCLLFLLAFDFGEGNDTGNP